MDRFEPNLRIPGPTGLPPSVREAGARQMINHRGPEFAAMLGRILTGMQPFFGTTSDVAIVTTAGTGGLEAAVVNTLSPGDRVLGRVDRLVRRPVRQDRPDLRRRRHQARRRMGTGGRPGGPARRAPAGRGYQAVLLTHNETSTGRHEPDPRAGRGRPRAGARRPDPGRQRVRSRRRAVRDGRLGRRRRRHRLAEGLDVRPRAGHDRRLAARLDRDGDRDHAARLPRPSRPSREPRRGTDARGRRPSRSSTRSTRASA